MRTVLTTFLAALMIGIPTMASAEGATLDIADVRGASFASGGKAMVTYRATTDAGSGVALGSRLPGARIPRTAAFDGLWGDAGYAGAWLAPSGKIQFRPASSFVEGATYTNAFDPTAAALGAGDRVEMAMASLGWASPLVWDRTRQAADGTLGWDHAVDARTVSARYGAATGEMDVVVVRADIVARGGDVDARGSSLSTPPLVIDLPRTYPKQTTGSYIVTNFFPYTSYVTGITMRVLPGAGKAVLTANVAGYVHEAREYALPNGARMGEWHLPLTAVVMVSAIDDPAEARGAISLPAPGVAFAGSGDVARRVEVPAGGTVVAGEGLLPEVLPAAPFARAGEGSGADEVAGTPWVEEELRAASAVDRSLAAPVELVAGNGAYALTLDPDFRGEGVLAVRSLRRGATGAKYADAWSVPYVVLDGQPVKLTRDRLTDLRVFPQYRWITIGFTGYGGTTPATKTRTLWGSAHQPGLVVDAVYDLGGGRHAFVNLLAAPELGKPGAVRAQVTVRSMSGAQVDARPVQYVELPAGQVWYGEEVMTHEFSAPFDVSGDHDTLTVGVRALLAGISRTGYEGVVTVKRAPAPLTAAPAPDPAVALGGGRIALTYLGPEGLPPGSTGFSSFRTELLADGAPPVPSPKPLGTPCGLPQAADVPVPDAPPALDVQTGWLDADAANLYATLRVADLPAAAPPDTILRWSLHWRYEHSGRFARANLDATGKWSFDFGGYNNGFFTTADVTGEVRTGANGLVRIVVPRELVGYRDGELLRDTGAHSWIDVRQVTVRIDDAPQEADPTFGTGSDYAVGACA